MGVRAYESRIVLDRLRESSCCIRHVACLPQQAPQQMPQQGQMPQQFPQQQQGGGNNPPQQMAPQGAVPGTRRRVGE